MNIKVKFKNKRYTHLDVKKNYLKYENLIKKPKWIASHGFYPFIHYKIKFNKYIYDEDINNKKKDPKGRNIFYSSHVDGYIYQYYGQLVNEYYDKKSIELGINKVATAYRNNLRGKCNIHFAKEVFEFICKCNNAFIYVSDFKGFFDNLDHNYLKEKLEYVLNVSKLPIDQYVIYKNITKYTYIELSDIKSVKDKNDNKVNAKAKYFNTQEFRSFKKNNLKKNKEEYGIPQGASISSVYSNIYMIDFDKKVNDYVTSNKGLYRRYCDDLIIIIPIRDDEEFNNECIEYGNKIESIVQDTPGVTRDRVYAEAEWLNHTFTMIDTGGIEPENQDIIVKQMRRQANIAIETADVIMFVVDGKEGLTAADNEVATMLRKSKKPVVLVVNKIDNLKDEENAWEFYNLGIGDPVAISAGQGKGLGDMLDMVVSHFDSIASIEEEEEDIKIAMIGKPNVGKSSLINRLLGEERLIVSDIAGTTRDAIDSKIESEFGKFTLIDTAGLRRKSKVKEEIERYSVIRTLAAVERADVCILMIDATEGVTEQDEKIIGFAHELNKAIMVIVNKWDLIEKDDKTMDNYKKDLQSKLKFIKYAKFLFISALTGQRAHKVLEVARECYDNYDKRIGTGVLNEVINKAVLMKEPPVVALKRLKIYYATQVATKPPKFVFFVNDSSCRHFSYERYLENQLRDNFDFSGTGIQIEYRERKDN